MKKIINNIKKEIIKLNELNIEEKIEAINQIKKIINTVDPQNAHPVSNITWIKSSKLVANDYNPNKVAPPEMKLLYTSIKEDGYTQPIVAVYDKEIEKYVVVDGFHRNRVGKEYSDINAAINDYLPVVILHKNIDQRMASTIRHNRARGTHQVQSMSEIVAELYLKGWSNKKIAEQLGMQIDEINRLKQFAGLGDLFKNRKFSKAWI